MVNFPLDGTSLVWSFQASVTSAHFCLILLPIAILSSFPLSCLLCSIILFFFLFGTLLALYSVDLYVIFWESLLM